MSLIPLLIKFKKGVSNVASAIISALLDDTGNILIDDDGNVLVDDDG